MNETVTYTKKLAELGKALVDVEKRFEALDDYRTESLAEHKAKLDAAVADHDVKMAEMEQVRKRKRVDDEIELKEHGREVAVKLLEEDGYRAIKAEEYDKLVKDYEQLQDRALNVEATTTTTVTEKLTREHKMEVERAKLKNEAELAKITEQNKMLLEKVEALEQMCDNYRKDVAAGQETIKCFAGRPTVVGSHKD